jgi:hypothetical protein
MANESGRKSRTQEELNTEIDEIQAQLQNLAATVSNAASRQIPKHVPSKEAAGSTSRTAWGLLSQLGLGGSLVAVSVNSWSASSRAVATPQSPGSGRGQTSHALADQLERAIGSEVLDHLSRQTGLTRDELLSRL